MLRTELRLLVQLTGVMCGTSAWSLLQGVIVDIVNCGFKDCDQRHGCAQTHLNTHYSFVYKANAHAWSITLSKEGCSKP